MAEPVASVFEINILPYFTVPKIFPSENRREFVNSVIEKPLYHHDPKEAGFCHDQRNHIRNM